MKKNLHFLCTLLIWAVSTPLLWAQNSVQTVDKVTSRVTLTDAVDYVITNTTPFTTAGSIDIQNPDATVIFQNIRPSDVISNYLSKVTCNGTKLTNNNNCRVSIYLHGAIVMPHSDTKNADGTPFYPVTFYTGDNFEGESMQYNGDARQTTGPWVDTVRSFKLKRGHMLTVANMANGTGYSHCYIANSKDIEVQMPKELAGKLGFFRIFRWQWPSKKGSCDVGPENLAAPWHYNWGAGSSSGTNFEYVPQRHHDAGNSNGQGWKGAWSDWGAINAADGTCTHVLGQNEPDNTSGAGEVYTYNLEIPENPRENCATSTLADHAAEFLYSGMRIGTYACCNPSTWWTTPYVNWCRENNIRVDFIATHFYIGSQSPQGCIDRCWALYNETGLPVWVTEWNNGANWTGESGFTTDTYGWYNWQSYSKETDNNAVQNSKMNGTWLTDVLKRADRDENHWLERLAVYNAVEFKREVWHGYVVGKDAQGNDIVEWKLTPGGELYYNYHSTFAYDERNEYFMPWTYKAPTNLKANYSTTGKTATLSWSHLNGKQTDSVHVERKVGSSQWTKIASITRPSSSFLTYQDDLNGIKGIVKYRIANFDSDKTTRRSGEVLITIASGSGSEFLQYNAITLPDLTEKIVPFDVEMTTTPAIFFGLSTYNNANLVLEPYIKYAYISTTEFKFKPISWRKQAKTGEFKNNEKIPFMAILPGNYHYDGMDIEVNTIAIKSDTIDVVFNEPFPEGVIPVVIMSPNSTTDTVRPLMHKVWNITNTGFRCVVMYEDGEINARGNHIVPSVNQYVSYIAATPGDVLVDEDAGTYLAAGYGQEEVITTSPWTQYFLLKVGETDEGEAINDTLRLVDPIVFCDTQTKNLPTPSVLRQRGYITEKKVDPDTGEQVTYTTGFKVRRIVDESVTSGINNLDSGTGDQVAWIALHTNQASQPTGVRQPIIEGTYSGDELNVRVQNRIIYVEGYKQFELFTAKGTRAASNATQVPGVYIVRAGGKTAKIVVK